MTIDFKNIAEAHLMEVFGGKGELVARNYVDDDCKIMLQKLMPGASTGLHRHVHNCEVMLILRGTATVHCDGEVETVSAGQVHYCPRGHEHFMENLTDAPLEYFAIVPKLAE